MLKNSVFCKNPAKVAPLFGDREETMIRSCLDGTMGELITDNAECPTAVLAAVGDFHLFAGRPCAALVGLLPRRAFTVAIPGNEQWAELIESCLGAAARRVTRYAFRKDTVFDREHLRRLAALAPQGYEFAEIDEKLYHACLTARWSSDLVSCYSSSAEFAAKGIGVLALSGGVPVAGASSYSSYRGGIEIEVDTEKTHRRRHLATACSARLILACLARGLYPSWDAQNLWSVGLAQKLGYVFSHEYPAYEIVCSEK